MTTCQLVDDYKIPSPIDCGLKYESSIYDTFNIKQTLLFDGYLRINILSQMNNNVQIPFDIINLCQRFFAINIKKCIVNDAKDIITNPFKRLYNFAKDCYNNTSEYWIASQILQYLCSLQPSNPEYYNVIGLLLDEWREFELAEQAFQTALQLKPQSHIYRWNYASALNSQKKYHLSLKLFLEASELDPGDSEYLYEAANCYSELRDYQNAEIMYRRAVEVDPNNAFYYVKLALFFRKINKSEAANEYLEKAEKLNPTNWEQNYQMAKYLRDYQVFIFINASNKFMSQLFQEFVLF